MIVQMSKAWYLKVSLSFRDDVVLVEKKEVV